jgi:hypothetical protein
MASSAPPAGLVAMRLPHAFHGLFRKAGDPALLPDDAAAIGAPAGAPARRAPTRADLRQFERRLRALARAASRTEPLVAGRLQIIALSRVRERLADDWPRLATRVHRLTRQILERRLAQEDVYVQAGERYVILFAGLASVEATFKAQAIAREITALLIGELPEVDAAPVEIAIHEIDPGELRARPTLVTLSARMDAATPRATATSAGVAGLRRADRCPPRFEYLPIWSRRGRAIVGYFSTCREAVAGDDQERYDLDCLALRSVLKALPRMARHGHAALVVVPVHWQTLVQLQRRHDYLDLCRQAQLPLNRHLGFAISDLAAGAWHDLIRDRLLPLKPFARLFLIWAQPEPAQIRQLAELGVDALAFEAPAAGVLDEAQHLRIQDFARDAARHNLATCALGVDRRSTALALLAAGIDFLGGDAIAAPVATPGAAYRLDLTAGGAGRK